MICVTVAFSGSHFDLFSAVRQLRPLAARAQQARYP
jgi:hypothetical protein